MAIYVAGGGGGQDDGPNGKHWGRNGEADATSYQLLKCIFSEKSRISFPIQENL